MLLAASPKAPMQARLTARLQGWRADEITVYGTKHNDSLQADEPCCSNNSLQAPGESVPASR